MSIRNKIYLALAILLAALLAQSSFMVYQANRIHHSSVAISSTYEPIVIKTYELQIAVIQIQQWITDISATRGQDGLNDGLDLAKEHYQAAQRLLSELAKLDSENAAIYQQIGPALDSYFTTGNRMAKAYVAEGPAGGNQIMAVFDKAAEALNDQVNTVLASVGERSRSNLDQQERFTVTLKNTVIILAVAFFATLIAMSFSVFSMLLKPIEVMSDMAKDLAQGEGDLTKRLDETRRDELGITAGWINRFVEKTHHTIQTMHQVVDELEHAAVNLSDSAKQANDGMTSQLAETEQAATAMNQLLSSAQEVAHNATNTAAKTETVNTQSQHGRNISDSTTAEISALMTEMESAQQAIERLGEDSKNIGGVLDVIKSISEQTNLLALNAAIEAARAGEQGRGFAVVADEVRTLAGRSQQSTEEIQEMVSKLHHSMDEAITVIQSGAEHAQRSSDAVAEVRGSLEEIDGNISSINSMNTQVATAAEQQSHLSTDISHNITTISEVARTNSDAVTAVHQISESLKLNVAKLNQLIGEFKI
ncbi:MAG: methyl-accepting chemotaxis protein [Halopseudomonas sp.]